MARCGHCGQEIVGAASVAVHGESEPLLIPVPVAARMLGISTAHAWRLVGEGVIPSMRLGYRVLVPRQAMLDWIAERTGYTHPTSPSEQEGGGRES